MVIRCILPWTCTARTEAAALQSSFADLKARASINSELGATHLR